MSRPVLLFIAAMQERDAATFGLSKGQPMFCFETGVKLFYWSCFVYDYQEVGTAPLQRAKQDLCGHCTVCAAYLRSLDADIQCCPAPNNNSLLESSARRRSTTQAAPPAN
jgi:hypothetical protein